MYLSGRLFGGEAEGRRRKERRDGERPTNGWSKLPLSNEVRDVCALN